MAGSFAGPEGRMDIIRVESVGMQALGYEELMTGTSAGDGRLERIVALAANGKYLVAVRSNIGIIRMKGAYLDSALTVEDGKFTFYYANGRLESEGHYVGGSKSGTWMRYALDGALLAERNYTGLSMETMVSTMGDAKEANLMEATEHHAFATPATRRSSTPIEF